jgi:PIN domain nuclease of toxin-antitoxin system
MKYLLDTHAFLWYVLGDPNLSPTAKEIIDNRTGICFSSVSLWEIAIKINIGKLQLNCSFEDLIKRLSYIKADLLAITAMDTQIYMSLPIEKHRDPFDRILVAQTINRSLILISRDLAFEQYSIQRLWE